ncbi:MAG: hypothetical protein HY898_25325 [Deltaproteobacteria bacterium]|nr:hypothetical protein [Deltaproteobacteria bacterium]
MVIANNTVINSKSAAITWDPGPHSNSVVRNNIFASQSGIGVILLVAKSASGVAATGRRCVVRRVGAAGRRRVDGSRQCRGPE